MKFCVVSSDPLYKYLEKGEIKPRYWNPENIFDEVHVFSFCRRDIEPLEVQALAGDARLEIIPLGEPTVGGLFGQLRTVKAAINRIQPDLIRAHNPWHAGLLGVLAGASAGVPVVISLHTHYDARRRHEGGMFLRALRPFERFSISRAAEVWCVSNYLTDYATGMGAKNVSVIYNRVYAEQFTPAVAQRHSRPRILSVGRLDPPKDQECLIRAICGLEVDLVLVGDGENRHELESLAQDLNISESVHFVGSVPHREIQNHYGVADIFALATHYEGFCIPILEAMAAGLPVVASDTQPLTEILGGTGLVVDHDPDAFRAAFQRLIDDANLAGELATRARQRAAYLDGSEMERREASLYRRVIEDHRQATGARSGKWRR